MSAIVLWSAKHRHHSVPQSPLKPFLRSRFQTYPPHMLPCHTLPCWACSFFCSLCVYFLYVIFFKWCCFPTNDSHESHMPQTGLNSTRVGSLCASILRPVMASSGDTYAWCSLFYLANMGRWFHKYTWAWISTKGSARHWPSNAGCWLIIHFHSYICVQMIFAYILTSIFKMYFTI